MIDTDGDGWSDGYEIAHGSNPFDRNITPLLHDMNGDGRVRVDDAFVLYRLIRGGKPLPGNADPTSLDLNGDGRLDKDDALILYRWSIGQSGYGILPILK